jgi:hypothetical protein
MSSYGPPGGPYPGQPQDPWGDTPTDPYSTGYPDPLTEAGLGQGPAHASSHSPGYAAYGPRPGPAPGSVTGEVWGPPRPSTVGGRSGRSGTAIGLIIVVVLLALAGGAAAAFFLTRDDGSKPTGGCQNGKPSAPASAASSGAGPSASPSANADAMVAKAGDCLVNRGTTEAPDMHKVACAANTYQVLKRIDGTADKEKCKGTPGFTDYYFFDHSDNKQDFVLCLKKR